MKKLNFTLLLFTAGFYYSQTISGTVISKNENQPVSYAKVGVDKENIGVITDENGNFTIDLSKANTSNKIKIEVAGYEPFTETVANFVKQDQQKIYLK
ncbi:carboxypeptidase-like regulatory domain-containing protein [Chryseobacterium sp. 2TAF14]|uniref:carboxypeptidase-like regulatory domain-containing protein n=1 Tax=Chryseobacterium sp. 2TAF14 TaxID=3233007 RepID=UPI003F904368